jgi:hypothetical protein
LFGGGRLGGDHPQQDARTSMIVEGRAANAADALELGEPLGRFAPANRFVAALRRNLENRAFHVGARPGRFRIEIPQVAFDANPRARVGGQEQRFRATRRRHAHQSIDAARRP